MIYNILWKIARPVLRRHKRMGEGFEQRLVPLSWPEPAAQGGTPAASAHPYQLWIHGASGGEAYLIRELVREILQKLPQQPNGLGILCTSMTRQGLDVLEKVRNDFSHNGVKITANYFPLDEPALMRRALRQIFTVPSAPKAVILLETEIWPGLLQACHETGVKVFIVNGRITPGSFKAYKYIRGTLKKLAPEHIFATTQEDLERFRHIFDEPAVADKAEASLCCSIMPNIKFDRIITADTAAPGDAPNLFAGQPAPIIALASVREEEEPDLHNVILNLLEQSPACCVAVAPRHMHRVQEWVMWLQESELDFGLRSQQQKMSSGKVMLWDTFGELELLYRASAAVFVGGSLAPLGGQNFLEPLSYGLVPCIGPSWSNFYWVGEELFTQGLAVRVGNASELVAALLKQVDLPKTPEKIKTALSAYLAPRQGGTSLAADYIIRAIWNQ